MVSESDVEDAARDLYPYLGFTGAESLQLEYEMDIGGETIYRFRQYIEGRRTDYIILLSVDEKDNQISSIRGSTVIDRGYDRFPSIGEEEVVRLAIQFAREKEESSGDGPRYRFNRGQIKTEVEYIAWGEDRIPEPAWSVFIPQQNPIDTENPFEKFLVYPDGRVVDFEGMLYIENVRTCDGSSQSGRPYCTESGKVLSSGAQASNLCQ